MSHFTTIKTQIKDIDALRSAVQEMGLSLLQKTTARGYHENNIKGDYVIRLKGPYDVAVNKQKDGTFALTCDWWDGHVEKEVGTNYGKLLQLYGVHKAIREAKRKGHLEHRVLSDSQQSKRDNRDHAGPHGPVESHPGTGLVGHGVPVRPGPALTHQT